MPTYTDTNLVDDLQRAVELLDRNYIQSAKIYHNFKMYTIERSGDDQLYLDKLYLYHGSRKVAEAYGCIAVKIFYNTILDIERKEGKHTFDLRCSDADDEIDETDISEYLMDHCPFELNDILEIRSCCDIYSKSKAIQKLTESDNASPAKKVIVRVAGITFSVEANEKGDICKRWRILMRNLDDECVNGYVGTFSDDFDSLEIFSKGKPIRFEIVSYLGTMNHGSYIYAKPGVYKVAVDHDVKSLHPSMWEDFGDGDIPDVTVKVDSCGTAPDIPSIAIKISKPGSEEEEE